MTEPAAPPVAAQKPKRPVKPVQVGVPQRDYTQSATAKHSLSPGPTDEGEPSDD